MRVLGIETSCDETAAAIYDSDQGLISHVLYSQIKTHAQFGGVVPELASRDHIRQILPLVQKAIDNANCNMNNLDGIAYTAGPGLIGALLVGAVFANTFAWARNLPVIPVHHMEAHLLAVMLEQSKPAFPFTGLLVSGGHTLLLHAKGLGEYEVLGETLDDAVGEAFDKTAKLIGLPYPGGAALSKLAEMGRQNEYRFPRPMVNRQGLEFSFSGLKTYALNVWKKSNQRQQDAADLACAFQEAVVDTLVIKCKRALNKTGTKRLVIAGGVAANKLLRDEMSEMGKKLSVDVFYPRVDYCTDNGAMVAYTGCQYLKHFKSNKASFFVDPRWSISKRD